MTPNTLIARLLATTVAAWSLGAYAAADGAPAAPAPVAEKAAKPMKPHSHMQEKTGMPQKPPAAQAAADPAKDKARHLHARDAK